MRPIPAGWLRVAGYAILFGYLVFIRTHTVTETFWFLGDQIRDWRIALRPWRELPLSGVPSLAGGTTFGPIYYWVLWLIRVSIGPLFDNLPHAGAIGLSLIQSAADLFLFHVLWQRLNSLALGLAAILLAASSPYEMAITATMWNPTLAVALSKITVALVLVRREWSLGRTAAVVAVGWLAVQAHMSALFVSMLAIGWMLLQPAWRRDIRTTLSALRLAVEVVVILQVPYLIHHLTSPGPAGGSAIRESVMAAVGNPSTLRWHDSFRALEGTMSYLLFAPGRLPWTGVLLVAAAAVALFVWRRDKPLLAIGIGPLALAVLGFAAWRGVMGETYWYFPLVPSAAVLLVLPLGGLRRDTLRAAAAGLALLLVIAAQPARCRTAWTIHRLPEYGTAVRAARQIAHRTPEVRAITAPFLPPSSDPEFLYEILGGQISSGAPLEASISPAGAVAYRPARP